MSILPWRMAVVIFLSIWICSTNAQSLDPDEIEKIDLSDPKNMVKSFVELEFNG
ncbi:MAG: hypothetical protein H7833_10170 [Magnetococcus sp. DMHC-1]|nr:hypothetical protein [Magnetococcales bacterium]